MLDQLGRSLSRNLESLLKRLEGPGRELANWVEELGEQLVLGQRELLRLLTERKRLELKSRELTEQARSWERRAELAVSQSDEALAREALVQRRRIESERQANDAAAEAFGLQALSLKRLLEQLRQRQSELRVAAVSGSPVAAPSAVATAPSVAAPSAVGTAPSAAVSLERLGVPSGSASPGARFAQAEARVEQELAYAEAKSEVDALLSSGLSPELEARFAELEARPNQAPSPSPVASATVALDEGALPPPGRRVRIEL